MKTALITIAAVFAFSGAALAYDNCSDRDDYCSAKQDKEPGTYGLNIFKPQIPNQPVDDRPGL